MGSSFGGTVKLTGESEYRKALREITNNLKVLNSEMKTVTSQFDKNDRSTSNLSQQSAVLTKKISEQRDKVNILTEALEQARRETGDNSDTTKKWQIELNNAQADLNKLERALKNNNDALNRQDDALDKTESGLKDYTDATEGAGTGTLKLADIIKANLISEGIIAGVRALGNTMQQVGNTIIGVGKQAFESYARYEQLVGGIETLFKESQDIVMQYAHNSYLTAGMSANMYMETVTGFSASLIQSLGGDTKKVAEISEMAITDMADNANKMGNSMESIRYAYMGFAKQNYVMLDNLKLGYGGTKAEMQRLLADAQKITGIKYDISNLADVYNAIHVIQGELGITGTTALEANTTIEGSMNRLKASWENVLVGIADDNADFGAVINNFVDSLLVAGENVLPRIEIIGSGMVKIFSGIAEGIVNNSPKVLEKIATMIPQLIGNVMSLVKLLVSTLMTELPTIISSFATVGGDMLNSLIEGMDKNLPNFIDKGLDMLIDFSKSFRNGVGNLVDAGIGVIMALVEGIAESLPSLIAKVPEIVINIANTINDNAPKLLVTALKIIVTLAEGLVKAIPTLIASIPKIIEAIVSSFFAINWVAMGKSLLTAIKNGFVGENPVILNAVRNLKDKIVELLKELPSKLFNLGKDAISHIVSAFKNINSLKSVLSIVKNAIVTAFKELPSKMLSIGKDIIKGLWNGLSNAKDWLWGKVKGLMKTLTNKIKDFFGIHSPSTLFRDEVGTNLALGLGEGFSDTMKNVTRDMTQAIPTEFDTSVRLNGGDEPTFSFGAMVLAFKQALKEMKIELDDREVGNFVTRTVERQVFA